MFTLEKILKLFQSVKDIKTFSEGKNLNTFSKCNRFIVFYCVKYN